MFLIFRRYSLFLYLILAFLPFWLLIPFGSGAFILITLVASFAPALAAILVTALSEGRTGLSTLFARFASRQVGWRWYLLALGIPTLVCVVITAISLVLGSQPAILSGPGLVLVIVIFVFAAGEELGWRGFMLPRLLRLFSPLTAAFIMGIIHSVYHLPLWITPGSTPPAYTFYSFFFTSLALGILWLFFYLNSRGSILVATLFHGAFNAAGNILFGGISPLLLTWLLPIGFGGAALLVLLVNRSVLLDRKSIVAA